MSALICFHCREPLRQSGLTARIGARSEAVCCAGCQAVAEMIAGAGLSDYYERRTAAAPRPEAAVRGADAWQAYLEPAVAAEYVRRGTNTDSIDLLIENLRCPACGWLIERTVGALDDVRRVDVNATLGRAHIEWTSGVAKLDAIMHAIARLGYTPHPVTAETTARVHRNERNAWLKRFAVATFGMMQVMMFAVADYSAALNGEAIEPQLAHYFRLISLFVTLPVVLFAARPFLLNAWSNLRTRTIGMDLPVSGAIVLAFVASTWNTFARSGEVYFDSITMFVFFLTLSRLIEIAVRHRTNSVADALARHLPATTERIEGTRVVTVATSQLRIGDRVIVPSGATVPADGDILEGETSLNEALLTGESLPVMRKPGDRVASGSINVGHPIRIAVAAIGAQTTLSSIVTLLRRAQTQKPLALQTSDRAAALFLRIVLIASVCVCTAWLYFDPSRAFAATLAVLVVACPCAFSIATPAALAASSANLARDGVLVTRPDALDTLTRVQHVVFDKTGTLTRGEIRLEYCSATGSLAHDDCLAIAAALEQASEHPIAAAFKSLATHGRTATEVRTVPGFGVEGCVDGKRYRIGAAAFVAELRGQSRSRLGELVTGTMVFLGDDTQELAAFALSDTLRSDSGAAVEDLGSLGITIEIVSGDSHAAVATVARRCGIPAFLARRTPAQKVGRVRELQTEGRSVAVLGDGINDAPVLAAADVSIAMGRGAALAIATADLVLVSERPSALGNVVRTARRTLAIARQNLIWSATYNFCALPLAALGWISPWIAAVGMSVSSMFVLLNALRLLPRAPVPRPHATLEAGLVNNAA